MTLFDCLEELFKYRLNVIQLCWTAHCSHECVQDDVELLFFRSVHIDDS